MQRQAVLEAAYLKHPDRFVRGLPMLPELPAAVWINKPETKEKESLLLLSCVPAGSQPNVVNIGKCEGPAAVVHISTTKVLGSSERRPRKGFGFDSNF
jgi:hypothetical protein